MKKSQNQTLKKRFKLTANEMRIVIENDEEKSVEFSVERIVLLFLEWVTFGCTIRNKLKLLLCKCDLFTFI